MSEWQPIETAPRDGTNIIVFCPFDGVSVAAWSRRNTWRGQSFDGPALRSEGDTWSYYQDSSYVTHWMPLPEPPK